MEDILYTNFNIPISKKITIYRDRLLKYLDEGNEHKLTLITAPAGYGKSTLLSNWAKNRKDTIWLSLGNYINDHSDFIKYLIAAFQVKNNNLGKNAIDIIYSPQELDYKSLINILINDIIKFNDKLTLILDDYYIIANEVSDEILNYFIEYLPENLSIIIISREKPNLQLAKLRVEAELYEIEKKDLCFSVNEIKEFLQEVMKVKISKRNLQLLEKNSEGWIAGIQLAVLSIENISNEESIFNSLSNSHHFIMDYLIDEVLKQQSTDLQNFLLITSILDKMNSDLCDALISNTSTSSQKIIEEIDRKNLFLISLDNNREWYRYHHLFQELLKHKLKFHDEIDINLLHKKASSWYEKNGYLTEAFSHSIEADDMNKAAEIAENIWEDFDMTFQTSKWINYINKIPKEIVEKNPILLTAHSWAHLNKGDLEDAIKLIIKAEKLINKINSNDSLPSEIIVYNKERINDLPASILIGRMYYSLTLNQNDEVIKYSREVLKLLGENKYLAKGQVDGLLGIVYWKQGKLELAKDSFLRGMTNMQKAGNHLFASTFIMGVVRVMYLMGEINEIINLCKDLIERYHTGENDLFLVLPDLYNDLAFAYMEQNKNRLALEALENSKKLGDQTSLINWKSDWYYAKSCLLKSGNNYVNALKMIYEAERYYIRTPLPQFFTFDSLKLRLFIKQKKLIKAKEWSKTLNLKLSMDFSDIYDTITLIRLVIASYKDKSITQYTLEETLEFLNKLIIKEYIEISITYKIELLILKAQIEHIIKKEKDCINSLEKAVVLAESQNFISLFINEGRDMSELLFKLASKTSKKEFILKLLNEFNEKGKIDEININYVDLLSKRELDILRLIKKGYSNPEIADTLFLALSTVKGYNQNIFSKLNVKRRAEAVIKAQELGIL